MIPSEFVRKKSIFKMALFPKEGVMPKHEGETSRNKYFVIIGVEDNKILAGSVLINSMINEKMFFRIAEFQHRITPSSYSFLTKEESYINCYNIIEISIDRIINDAEYIGELLDDDFSCIKDLLHKSPAIKPAMLKEYHMK